MLQKPHLREAIEGSRTVYHGRHNPQSHPRLYRRRKGRDSKKHRTTAKVITIFRRRGDRSEAQARLLAFLFARVDLRFGEHAFEVGDWQDELGGVRFFRLTELRKALGLSRWRLDRAISDLRAAEYIYRHQSREVAIENGAEKWAGHVARFKLTVKAFEACGVSRERLQVFRRRDAEKDQKAEKRGKYSAPVGPVGTLLSETMDPAIRDLRPSLPPGIAAADEEAFRRLTWDVGREHRDWDEDQVFEEARRRLYRRGRPPPVRR